MPLPSQCARWELHRCYSELCFWLGRQIIPTHIRFGQHEQIDRYDALALPVDWFRDYLSCCASSRRRSESCSKLFGQHVHHPASGLAENCRCTDLMQHPAVIIVFQTLPDTVSEL